MEDAVPGLGAVLRAQPEVKPGRVFELGLRPRRIRGMPRIAEADGKLAGMAIVNGNARPQEDVAAGRSAESFRDRGAHPHGRQACGLPGADGGF
jgi:hypothetical protein